jgi:fumiquinazoline A oxidase
VQIASAHNIPFLATGGGHGFSLGYGSVQHAVNVDMGNFKSVNLDAEENTLTIGGAVTLSQVWDPLYLAGKELRTLSRLVPRSMFPKLIDP